MAEQIKIKYHVDGLEKINKIKVGDWLDLRAAEDVTLHVGEFKLISLGISMKLPAGYEAHIVPRSSTFKTWGIIQTNSMGVIDESYCGNDDIWKFPALCLQAKDEKKSTTQPVSTLTMVNDNKQTMPIEQLQNSTTSTIHKGDRICQFRIMKKQPEIEFVEVEEMEDENRGGFGHTGKN